MLNISDFDPENLEHGGQESDDDDDDDDDHGNVIDENAGREHYEIVG